MAAGPSVFEAGKSGWKDDLKELTLEKTREAGSPAPSHDPDPPAPVDHARERSGNVEEVRLPGHYPGEAVHQLDRSETIREVLALLDLAISRVRASRLTDEGLRGAIHDVLRSARRELLVLPDKQDHPTIELPSCAGNRRR